MPVPNQFTIEQLAGNLLENAHRNSGLATGFKPGNHMHTAKAGRIAEGTRIENVVRPSETTRHGLVGLTLQCARCHDTSSSHRTKITLPSSSFFNQNVRFSSGNRSLAIPPSNGFTLPPTVAKFWSSRQKGAKLKSKWTGDSKLAGRRQATWESERQRTSRNV